MQVLHRHRFVVDAFPQPARRGCRHSDRVRGLSRRRGRGRSTRQQLRRRCRRSPSNESSDSGDGPMRRTSRTATSYPATIAARSRDPGTSISPAERDRRGDDDGAGMQRRVLMDVVDLVHRRDRACVERCRFGVALRPRAGILPSRSSGAASLPVSLRAPCIAACRWSATQRRARASTLAGNAAEATSRQYAAHARATVIGSSSRFMDTDGRRRDDRARLRATRARSSRNAASRSGSADESSSRSAD